VKEPGVTREHFDGSREVLARVRALTARSRPPDRIDTIADSMSWAMAAALMEVPTANGNDPFALFRLMQVRLIFTGGERWGRYYEVRRPESPVLDLVGVRYLLSRNAVNGQGLVPVAQLPGRQVYENPDSLPRFFLVRRVRPAVSMEDALAMMRSPEFRPGEEAVVEGVSEEQGAAPAAGIVRVVEYRNRSVRLEVETSAPALLVTSEAWYPGWRAWIDGGERPLVLTNAAFRGLSVPAAEHIVEMRFEPAILWRSAAVSAVAWLAALAAFAFGDNRRKRGRWISSST